MPQQLLSNKFLELRHDEGFFIKPTTPSHPLYNSVIDYASGIPDPEALPYSKIQTGFETVLNSDKSFDSLSYSDFSGVPELREHVARYRGVNVENVIITNGAMQGIFLSAAALVNPNDTVLVDNPVFPEAKRIFRLAGARIDTLDVDRNGPDIDELERRLAAGKRYKALYTVPDFQNPTGSVTDDESKRRLLELAEHYGFVIVADNPYRDLWFDTPPAEFPQEARICTTGGHLLEIGSFSKILGPGWRIGWIIASRDIIKALTSFRRSVDGHPSTLEQYVISYLMDNPAWFEQTIQQERLLYKRKAQALYRALIEAFPDDITVHLPRGGYFLWGELPSRLSLDNPEFVEELLTRQVRYVPGNPFFTGDTPHPQLRFRFIRLSFAHTPLDDLIDGVDRIREAADALLAG